MKKLLLIIAALCIMVALVACSAGGYDVSIANETTIFEETQFGTGASMGEDDEIVEPVEEGDGKEEGEEQDGDGGDDKDAGEKTEEYIKA